MVPDLPPERLFKFRPLVTDQDWSRLEDILVRKQIWFSTLDRFNDPFEGHTSSFMPANHPQSQRWARRAARSFAIGSRKERREQRDRAAKSAMRGFQLNGRMPSHDFGVFCLMELSAETESSEDILSWSHYAGGHNGVAIGFRAALTAPFNIFSFARPVRYFEEKPISNVLDDKSDEKLDAALFAKAGCWGYEREWRIISSDTPWEAADIRGMIDRNEILERGALRDFLAFPPRVNDCAEFDPEDVVEIRIGVRVSESSRARILQLVKLGNLSPNIRVTRIHPSKYSLVYS